MTIGWVHGFVFVSISVLGCLALKDMGIPNFSCPDMSPSAQIPTSVHALKPADIKVTAAMGDSLTAANGAGAPKNDPVAILLQYRGLSFQGGGDKSLEQHVTLPNILRKFNPSLFGFANGISSSDVWDKAHLNVGFPGAESGDLPRQARQIVQLMQTHSEIDVQNDWKLINIFIGGNDVCAECKDSLKNSSGPHSATNFAKNIQNAVQILYDNLPRTLVSLTGMFNMKLLRQVDNNQVFCQDLHVFECPCESDHGFSNEQISEVCKSYMAAEQNILDQGVFDKKDDFSFVIQPYFEGEIFPPENADGSIDLDFFAADCFHFSQYGHAGVSKYLWNSIMQPVGQKTSGANFSNFDFDLLCPDPKCPFIRTTKNSQDCTKYFKPTKLY